MTETTLRVAMICTGNICRSPMAEVVMRQLVDDDSLLSGRVNVTSAGTANWHVGDQMDERARRALDRAGYSGAGSPAEFADRNFLNDHDVVVVMTREHVHEVLHRTSNPATEVVLLRNVLDPGCNLDVADPYYGDDKDFDECLSLLSRAAQRLTLEFRRRLGADSSGV